jgi:hypothetical protein
VFQQHVSELLAKLSPSDLVLDVGGWACPFNRANWILDAEPYETRGYYRTFGGPASQGGDKEWFTRDTWVRRDICAREPWQFTDKQFDFVVCSHTLEDIRDPLWVCSELVRVGKRGYIEVPSREWETCRGLERPNQVGLSHHRWLIDIAGSQVRFLQKFHMIHSHWRFSFPAAHKQAVAGERGVAWLWWEGAFEFSEVTIHGIENQEAELERFVQQTAPYPEWRLATDRLLRRVGAVQSRVTAKLKRAFARRAKVEGSG